MCLPVTAHIALRSVRSSVRTPPRRVQPRLRRRVCVSLKVFPVFYRCWSGGSTHPRFITPLMLRPWPAACWCAATPGGEGAQRRVAGAHVSNTTVIVSFSACHHVKRRNLRVCSGRDGRKDFISFQTLMINSYVFYDAAFLKILSVLLFSWRLHQFPRIACQESLKITSCCGVKLNLKLI